MGISGIDVVILIAYLAGIMLIGCLCMKKVSSFSDYAVAGRTMPKALIFASLAATCIGGGATTGRVAYAYQTGIIIAFIGLAAVLNHIIAGLFIAPKIRKMKNIYTAGDIAAFYYGKSGRLVTGIITFLFCAAMFGSQILAMGNILHVITGLPMLKLIIGASIFVIIYTWAGGMLAVIYTDAIQFIVLVGGIALASVLALKGVGGMDQLIASVPASNLAVKDVIPTSTIVTLAVSYMFGEFMAPYFINRYASSDSSNTAMKSSIMFGIFYFFFVFMDCMIGLVGIVTVPGIAPDAVMSTVIKDSLPIGITGLVFAALISAIMSSGDSILNTAAVIFSRDIYNKFLNKNATDKQLLTVSKVGTLVIGVAGVVIALTAEGVFEAMTGLYGYWAPSLVPPLAVAIIWGGALERKISPYAGIAGVIVGLVTKVVWDRLGMPGGIPSIVIGIVLNVITLFLVHALTKNHKVTNGFFVPEEVDEV